MAQVKSGHKILSGINYASYKPRKRPGKANGRCYVKTDKRVNFRYHVKNKKSRIDRDLVILSLPLLLPTFSLMILFIFGLLLP